MNQKKAYELVDILPFNARKRMSIAVKDPSRPQEVLLFTKGADSQVFEKAQKYKHEREITS